jgi:hypothetical protein
VLLHILRKPEIAASILSPVDMATTWVNLTLFSIEALAIKAPFTATIAPALQSSGHAVLESASSEGPVQTINAVFVSIRIFSWNNITFVALTQTPTTRVAEVPKKCSR